MTVQLGFVGYHTYYGGLGGYAKADKGQDGWADWYRAAADGLW